MGTNYCKNITYDGCTLSRLDAHAGVVNASIINGSNVIHVNLIGGGTALIKDSTIHNGTMITLRSDYGSTWNGDVQIINSTQVTTSATPSIISGSWVNHNFGYITYLPHTVVIDGYKLEGNASKVYAFGAYGLSDPENDVTGDTYGNAENKNPLVLAEKIIVRNKVAGAPEIVAAPAGSFFATKMTVTEEEDE
jgi:hypothetical protein